MAPNCKDNAKLGANNNDEVKKFIFMRGTGDERLRIGNLY
jgi:hypothetical protein